MRGIKTKKSKLFLKLAQLGGKLSIPLFSENKQEEFLLDISRSRIVVSKTTFQNRARKTIVLLRLDLGGTPHRNPDGEEISSPHLHIYKYGLLQYRGETEYRYGVICMNKKERNYDIKMITWSQKEDSLSYLAS